MTTERPLTGRRVLVTRAQAQSSELVALLENAGADVVHHAAIEVVAPPSWDSLDALIDTTSSFRWILFTSTNGVEAFLARAAERGNELSLRGINVAAVGRSTADALRSHGVEPDIVPAKFQASELLPLLPAELSGVRCAIVRALEGREILADELRARGAEVHVAFAYETIKAASLPADVKALLRAGAIDAITFTSPSTVEGTLAHLSTEEIARVVATSCVVSIGPVTTEALGRRGVTGIVEAEESTVEGIVAAVIAQFSRR